MALFDKIKDVAKDAASFTKKTAEKAAEKASETIEIGKLRRAISFEGSKIAANKTQIGEYYYELFLRGQELPLEIVTLCEGIKLCEELIGEKQREIDAIKSAQGQPEDDEPIEEAVVLEEEHLDPPSVEGEIEIEIVDQP